MLPGVLDRLRELPDDAVVLDVGGWAAPIHRADWVLDAMPYQTRGALGFSFGDGMERFGPATWVERDICDREPWPFADDFFDFSICVTTLEDVRDPIWVCNELGRVSKAGYVEVPAIELELCRYVDESQGPWLGHSHHRWFCELDADRSKLVVWHKSHAIHSDRRLRLTHAQIDPLGAEGLLQGMFWTGSLSARERLMIDRDGLDEVRQRLRRRFPPSRLEAAKLAARVRVGVLPGYLRRSRRRRRP